MYWAQFLEYVWYFAQIVLYSLGGLVLCGLIVSGCLHLFCHLMGGGIGYGVVVATSILGTPVHELGHAIMCLIFGHSVEKIVLWRPEGLKDGTMGYVTHGYNTKNLYHQFGNLFIGVAPIFSGMAVLTLALHFCFPQTIQKYFSATELLVKQGDAGLSLILEGLKMVPNLILEFKSDAVPVWVRILGLLVMLSVSLHINLSVADIRGAALAIPMYLVLVLLVTIVTALIGASAMEATVHVLKLYSSFMTSLFVIVLVFALVQVAIGFIVWLIRTLITKNAS